jgi:hypothetical protein
MESIEDGVNLVEVCANEERHAGEAASLDEIDGPLQ